MEFRVLFIRFLIINSIFKALRGNFLFVLILYAPDEISSPLLFYYPPGIENFVVIQFVNVIFNHFAQERVTIPSKFE